MVSTARAARKKAAAAQTSNRYDAAGNGRRLAGWRPPSSGPNKVLAGLSKIRDRAQDVIRNDWAGEGSIQKWTTALVGTGIVPRWQSVVIEKLFAEHAKVCDADCVLDYYGLQALIVRTWLGPGECFVRRRNRALRLNLPVPVQYQVIEAEYCPIFDADRWPGMPAGNRITQGVEFTKFGERAAYWFYKEHPNDGARSPTQNDLIRVPASEVRHVFEVKRPGQIRGVSSLAPILIRVRNTGNLEDATLDRQQLANLFALFITRALPTDWTDLEFDDDTGLPKFYGADGQPMAGLEPGIAQELRPGEDVKFANPPGAGVEFPSYLRSTQLGTAAGQGLPYELFSGDIANISDRTLRVVMQEFRRFAQQRQWHTVIPQACQGMIEWFADAAVLAGKLPLSLRQEARNPEHNPHGWDYLHPVQDVQGKVMAIDAGLTSRDRVISERGDDPRKIDKERAAAKERADKLGLAPPPPAAAGSGDPSGKPGAPAPSPAPQAVDLTPVVSALAQMMQSMQAVVGQIAAVHAQQPQAAAPAAPVIHNHLPAPIVNVEPPAVTVAAPVVNVEPAAVSVAAPVVNVEPPTVTVAAPNVQITNEVQPADVTVDVNLPPRETTSVIGRDGRGDITKVVQTERTLPN